IMRYLSMNETWEINGPEQPGMLQYGNAALGVSFNLMNMLIFYPNSTLMAERMSWLTPQVCSGNFFAGAVTRLFWSNGEYQYAYAYFYVNVTGDEAYIVGYPTIITSNFIEKGYVTVMGQPCYTNPIGPLFNGTAYPVAFEVNLDMPYSQVTSLPYTWYWWYVGNMTVIIIK
uniref:hypothetical protein n=1 Tax=Vulcanisaeta sp. JCM 16159 TaxID=1295371 RepID=UPI000AA488A0